MICCCACNDVDELLLLVPFWNVLHVVLDGEETYVHLLCLAAAVGALHVRWLFLVTQFVCATKDRAVHGNKRHSIKL